jgi:hypothetical protein
MAAKCWISGLCTPVAVSPELPFHWPVGLMVAVWMDDDSATLRWGTGQWLM